MFLAISFKADHFRQQVLDILSDYPIKVKLTHSISKLIDTQFKIDSLKERVSQGDQEAIVMLKIKEKEVGIQIGSN